MRSRFGYSAIGKEVLFARWGEVVSVNLVLGAELWHLRRDVLFLLLGLGVLGLDFSRHFSLLLRVLGNGFGAILYVFGLPVILNELGVTKRYGAQVVFWLPFHRPILESRLQETKESRCNLGLEAEEFIAVECGRKKLDFAEPNALHSLSD